jgi:hypothetical protein
MTTLDARSTARHRGGRARYALSTTTIATIAVALIGGGSAWAYFSQHGSSQAGASVGHGFAISSDVVIPTGTVLYPGGPKGGFVITVVPGSRPFRITDIVQDPSRPVVVTNAPGCPATVGSGPTVDPVVALTAQHLLTLDVAAAPVTKTYAAAVSISAIAPNACQGATFAIPVVLTGRSL